MFDHNQAIAVYSAAAVRRRNDLERYCQATGFSSDVSALADSIDRMQDAVFDIVWERSKTHHLDEQEIRTLAQEYFAVIELKLNTAAIDAILQWVIWMSWHEGCLKLDPPRANAKRRWKL